MKKILVLLLGFVLSLSVNSFAATSLISQLTNDANPTSDDLMETENDPLGTPGSRKVTIGNLQTKIFTADDQDTVGLGSGKGLIEFEDESTDNINLMNAFIGMGTTAPTNRLVVANGSLQVSDLISCNTVDTNSSGVFICGSDATGGDAGGINWSDATRITTIDTDWDFLIRNTDTSDDSVIAWSVLQPYIFNYEGTVDGFETQISFEDPLADATLTVQEGITGLIIPFDETDAQNGDGVKLACAGGRCNLVTNGNPIPAEDGDVTHSGAAPSDNAIARYDSTTGQVIQSSLCTINDSGVLTCPSFNATQAGPVTNLGGEGADAALVLDADEGDDNADTWTINSEADDNDLDFINHTTTVASLSSTGILTSTRLNIDGTTCLEVSSDRIYHDTNCSGAKDSGEEFIDQAAATVTQTKSFVIEDPDSVDLFTLWKAKAAQTITSIDCIIDPADTGESAVINFLEANSTADSGATVDATITCDNDGAADDGSFTNPSIDSGDWTQLDIGTVSGTVSQLTVTVKYTE